jgi:EmrB/QacA subfamily drug resistance transporter
VSGGLLDPRGLAGSTAAPQRPGWLVPAIVGTALLMQLIESTVMANALPVIAAALHEDPLRLNMAITMFLLASAVFLPVSGWVADKFGAKRIFMASMVLFAISSAGCGLARSLPELIVARIFQGASAAMMSPVGRLVVLRTTPKSELVGALSVLTMPALIAPLIGPMLGGFIVTYFNWRWIFLINLPIAVVAVILVRAFVPNVTEAAPPRIDWAGVVLTGVGLASLMFGFENLGRAFLPLWQVATLFAVALVCFALYARHARGNPDAVIDVAVFRIPTFGAATIGGNFLRIGVGALPFLLAMLLQIGFGMSAFAAAGVTFISGAAAFAMKGGAPPILRRFGFRPVLLFNGALVAMTFLLYAFFTPGWPRWAIMLVLAIGGFFRSLQFTSLGGLTYADIDSDQLSRASTAASMAQQLAQAVGIGLAATLVHFIQTWRGDAELTWQAVTPTFAVIGAISLVSMPWFLRLPRDAGDEMNGRGPPRPA